LVSRPQNTQAWSILAPYIDPLVKTIGDTTKKWFRMTTMRQAKTGLNHFVKK
jgi:hypothetical protein